MDSRVALAFHRFDRAELKFCRYLNRPNGYVVIRYVFRGVSWLGDGWFWDALSAPSPLLYGAEGWPVALQMTLTGAAGVFIYKAIKGRAVRERPFITHA